MHLLILSPKMPLSRLHLSLPHLAYIMHSFQRLLPDIRASSHSSSSRFARALYWAAALGFPLLKNVRMSEFSGLGGCLARWLPRQKMHSKTCKPLLLGQASNARGIASSSFGLPAPWRFGLCWRRRKKRKKPPGYFPLFPRYSLLGYQGVSRMRTKCRTDTGHDRRRACGL